MLEIAFIDDDANKAMKKSSILNFAQFTLM